MSGGAERTSRRDFFRSAMGLSLVVVGASACRNVSVPLSCGVGPAVTSEDLHVRATLGYLERSQDMGRTCATCQQYVLSTSEGACGSCKVLKGDIHPNGTCKAFSPKA